MASDNRLFLSYAREDDEPFVKRLCQDLNARGFVVWWDRLSMPSRGLRFSQEIRDAIDRSDRLLLILGPRAVSSPYVTAEWQHALTFAKTVVPLLRRGDYSLLPEDLAGFHAIDARETRPYVDALGEIVRVLCQGR